MKQHIQRITPDMLRNQPDQVCSILNQLIEAINALEQ